MTSPDPPGNHAGVLRWIEQGVTLGGQGRHEEAASCFLWALHLQPDCVDAHFCLGLAHHQQGRFDEAAACYERTLQLDSNRLDALNNLGHLGDQHKARGDFDRAVACYQRLLHYKPDHAGAHYNLGIAFAEQRRFEEAVTSFQQATRLDAGHADAHNGLGIALAALGRFEEAVVSYEQSLRFRPDYAEVHNNLGAALDKLGRLDNAVESYREAIRLEPDCIQVYTNLASVLLRRGKLDDAITCCRQAIQLRPDWAQGYSDLGNAFFRQGDLSQAEACYQHALALDPECVEAHVSRAQALLITGNYLEGWQEFEWRHRRADADWRFADVLCWDGRPLEGRIILLHAEQGLGDTIQFLRYAPLVKARGGIVLLECAARLHPLLRPGWGIDRVLAEGEIVDHIDAHAPLVSLPRIFGTTLDTIPVGIPYLHVDAARVEHWRNALAFERRFKVGLVWRGSPRYIWDLARSAPLKEFRPLAELPSVAFFGLQTGVDSDELESAEFSVTNLPASFADLSAVLMNLDLLIAVDTAPAHLAGALGLPVWLALPFIPDWRWLLDRSDSPWYPAARLFRQQHAGEWNTVFEQIAIELRELVDHR